MKYSEFMVIQGDSMVASWEDILWRYEIEWRYNGISNHIDMILGYFGCIWNWGILSIKMHFNENNDDKPWDLGCPVFRQTHVVPLIQRTWGFWKFGRWWYQSESMQTCRNRGFEHVIFWLNIEHIGGRMFDPFGILYQSGLGYLGNNDLHSVPPIGLVDLCWSVSFVSWNWYKELVLSILQFSFCKLAPQLAVCVPMDFWSM